VEYAARQADYAVFLCDFNEYPTGEDGHLRRLFFSRPVDGVLVTCWADSTAYATLVRHSFPAVFFNRLSPTLCLTRTISSEGTVSTDNVQAGYAATRHLIELGHERIAMPVGHTGLSPYHDRLEGFRKAMQESNLPNRDECLFAGCVN
jgi:DNA-binding LacI/PurR family transcriptional regulator